MMLLRSLLSVLVTVGLSWARSTGPPDNAERVCEDISPEPSFHRADASAGNGGYVIATDIPLNGSYYLYDEGMTYTVQVRNLDGNTVFRGFLVQARDPGGEAIGTFMPDAEAGQRLVVCTDRNIAAGTTIGHSRPTGVPLQTFMWQAPSGSGSSMVDFRYAVVQVQIIYFADQSAAQSAAAANMEISIIDADAPDTEAPPSNLPQTVSMPTRSPDDYRITIRDPADCEVSSCDLFIGIDTNEGDNAFLDVYIEGDSTGWVAVGFSTSRSMLTSDVVACNLNTDSNMVEVLDTWNPTETPRTNRRDPTQDVGVFSASSESGRITCTFARRIQGSDPPPQDFNLDSAYYILFGMSPNSVPGQLLPHDFGPAGNPSITEEQINPARDRASVGGADTTNQENLTRAHGIFMIIAWPILAVTAIFFAAWMRPALPNGEWFQVHRAFMIASLFVGALGFLLIFVAQYNRSPNRGLINLGSGSERETAHFAIGILVMGLQIANPIIAIFRCHPGEKNRWIFNLVHGTLIGLGAELLALINVGIGIALFSENFSRFANLTIFYVYLAFIIFFVAMIAVLFIVYTLLAYKSDDDERAKLAPSLSKPLFSTSDKGKGQATEMSSPGGDKPDKPAEDKPKQPSRDSPLRWGSLAVFLAVMVPIMIVLIILIALPR